MAGLHIQRADNTTTAFVQDMGVNHRGIYVFCRAHLFGVRLVVKENEVAHPVRIGLFSADAVAHHPDSGTHLIQESGRGAGSFLAIFHPENFRLS